MPKFLIIQTAFIGDVVLATAVAEKLHEKFPDAQVDFLLRKGNEGLLKYHPFIKNIIIWDKQSGKYSNLLKTILSVRKQKYSHVFNLHRFGSSGLVTFLSGAKYKAGFDKNPFSFSYKQKVTHVISEPYAANPVHETDRNQRLISEITGDTAMRPRLYPSEDDYSRVRPLQTGQYICIAPSSVWFTKQFPTQKWIELLDFLPKDHKIYLLGGANDEVMAKAIMQNTLHPAVTSLCGSISFLQSAALMQGAAMNYVNDSAPLHFASAVNAPVTAVYCSTVPAFGFGPLSDRSKIVELEERLYCRPCGLHGYNACPEGHFRCALDIKKEQLLWWTSKQISGQL
jgi:heptosyltransferase II